jgi:hypothetical protein
MREGLEDPLDDMGLVQQQLEQISVIMRMDYAKTCSLLICLFKQSAPIRAVIPRTCQVFYCHHCGLGHTGRFVVIK